MIMADNLHLSSVGCRYQSVVKAVHRMLLDVPVDAENTGRHLIDKTEVVGH